MSQRLKAVEELRKPVKELVLPVYGAYEELKPRLEEIPDSSIRRLFRTFLKFCERVGGKMTFERYRHENYEEVYSSCILPAPSYAELSVDTQGGGTLNIGVMGAETNILTPEDWRVIVSGGTVGEGCKEIFLRAEKEVISPEAWKWKVRVSCR